MPKTKKVKKPKGLTGARGKGDMVTRGPAKRNSLSHGCVLIKTPRRKAKPPFQTGYILYYNIIKLSFIFM